MLPFCLLLGISTITLGQTKMDADASDIAALQQRLNLAHDHKLNIPLDQIDSRDSLSQAKKELAWCNKNNYHDGPWDNHSICESVAHYYTSAKEAALLRGCSFPIVASNSKESFDGSCMQLGYLYEGQQRWIEALAVYRSPNIEDTIRRSAIVVGTAIARAYKSLGNNAMVKSELHHVCYDLDDLDSCQQLKSIGEPVDMDDAHQRADHATDESRADEAQRQAEAEQEQRDKAASRAATIAALSSIGATPQGSAAAPSYSPPAGRPSNPSYSAPSSTQSTQSCRDMTACVKVVSSTYDANHFLHVVVRNSCGSQVRVTTSVYAQNRSCTVGQTDNLNPGVSEDLGQSTDRNWYQIQADDSVRSSIDGSGCRLVIANSCDR
jgi:hypothetical protein